MPVDKRKVTIKTLLISASVPLLAFGVERWVANEVTQAAVAFAMGVAFAAVYVAFQEYDVPYEEEIRQIVIDADITTEDLQELSEDMTSQVESDVSQPEPQGEGD